MRRLNPFSVSFMQLAITVSQRSIKLKHNCITRLLRLVDIVVRKWRLDTGTGLG